MRAATKEEGLKNQLERVCKKKLMSLSERKRARSAEREKKELETEINYEYQSSAGMV